MTVGAVKSEDVTAEPATSTVEIAVGLKKKTKQNKDA